MRVWSAIVDALKGHAACALVTQLEVAGSAPREAGVRMVVMPDGTFTGTIGGGALEWRVLARARGMLRGGAAGLDIASHALGPDMGQCCGGAVKVMIEVWTVERLSEAEVLAEAEAAGPFSCESVVATNTVERTVSIEMPGESSAIDLPLSGQARGKQLGAGGENLTEQFGESARQLYLFGAGHVGRALVLALAPLPFDVTWIDERRQAFPAAVPGNVTMVASTDPAGELAAAPDGAFVLAMTHSHACDQAIVYAALKAGRFGSVGVIGSQTKRARFISRLRKAGIEEKRLAALVCPIGMPGVSSKTPAAIAAVVAAQLLQHDELVKTGRNPVQSPAMEFKLHQTG